MNTVRIGTALGLAWAGLAVIPSAYSQALVLSTGDAVGVSGLGTVGTVGGTIYLPGQNTTASYEASGGSYYAVLTTDTAAFTLGNGGTLTGGYQGAGLDAWGYGTVNVRGGTLTGGQYGYGLKADGGTVNVSGGTLTGGDGGDGLGAGGDGQVNVSGGTLTAGDGGTGLLAFGYGPVTITGGNITGGKGGVGLKASNTTLNLFSQNGAPFLIDGVPMNTVSLTKAYHFSNVNGSLDTISGILLNGDILNTTFESYNANINLNIGTPPALPVPEASTTVSFGLLLALGGLVIAAKRKRTTGKASSTL